jgi:hypothetical protein
VSEFVRYGWRCEGPATIGKPVAARERLPRVDNLAVSLMGAGAALECIVKAPSTGTSLPGNMTQVHQLLAIVTASFTLSYFIGGVLRLKS